MRLAAAVLAVLSVSFAQPGLARTKSKDKNIKQASYSRTESSSTYGMRSEKTESSPASSPEFKAVFGTVYGLNRLVEDGDAKLVGFDAIIKLTPKAFIPIGLNRWEGALNSDQLGGLIDGDMTMSTVDLGIGYRGHLTAKTYIPVGIRFGWYEMELSGNSAGVPFSFEDYGRCVTPFSGFQTAVSRRVSIGYEVKLPLCSSSDRSGDEEDEDDEDEDAKSNSVLSYHAFALTFSL